MALGDMAAGRAPWANLYEFTLTGTLSAVTVFLLALGAVAWVVAGLPGPGDTLEYRATYTNRGAAPARGVLATLPVPPDGMEYVDASAAPAKVLASLDGKQFAPAPLQRVVVLPDGSRKSEAVPASEYRFLRWNLGDLDAGKSVVVRSRMRLIGAPR